MPTVNFRVVGMYFGRNQPQDENGQPDPKAIVVEVEDNPSVFQVMKAVAQKVRDEQPIGVDLFGFSPSNPGSGEDLTSIFINHTQPPKGELPTGLYVLTDNAATNPFSTFQYYIYDDNFEQVNKDGKFIPFSNKPNQEIRNNYTVIIRQVNICSGPINNARVMARAEIAANNIAGAQPA
ncbi:MAG: hypothetical protein ACFB10_18690 [Salibacteraceae bacterium]